MSRVDGSMAWGYFLGKMSIKQISRFYKHVVHLFALKQNQCIEFLILSGKWIELLLVGNINGLIAYHKSQLYRTK